MLVQFSDAKTTKVSRTLPKNNSETVEREEENAGFDREIQKNISFQKKDRKLLIIQDQYNNILIETKT